jgi:hypothetical protein
MQLQRRNERTGKGKKERRMSIRKRCDDFTDIEAFEFCEWVADWVCDDNFEEVSSDFAELACRKLWQMGMVLKDGEDWKRE